MAIARRRVTKPAWVHNTTWRGGAPIGHFTQMRRIRLFNAMQAEFARRREQDAALIAQDIDLVEFNLNKYARDPGRWFKGTR